jgi:hypothetical protein
MSNPLTEPAYLDRFFPKDPEGYDLIAPAFYFGFYFPDGYRAAMRERATQVCDDYWRLCGKDLEWMITPVKCTWKKIPKDYDMHRWREDLARETFAKFGPKPKRQKALTQRDSNRDAIEDNLPEHSSLQQWLSEFPDRDWVWQSIFHSGQSKDEAAQFQILGHGDSTRTDGYSYLYLFVPITWFAEHPGENPIAVYLRWSTLLQARHGTAGFGLVPPEDEARKGEVQSIARAFANQCPGIELCDPIGQWGIARGGTLAPNWLTMIDQQFVDQLGGRDAIQTNLTNTALNEPIGIHPYQGGLILSAGKQPQLYENDELKRPPNAYQTVARALQPIRSTEAWGFWGANVDDPLDWLARFD